MSRLQASTDSRFSYFAYLVMGLIPITGGAFLVLGFMIPIVSIIAATCQVIAAHLGLSVGDPLQGKRFGWAALLLLPASVTIALFFLSPGAYSIDSRRYGRRRIFIPSSKEEENEES